MNLESMFSLEGKNAIVVGGSKGIGKGIALGLANAGASVVLCSRNQAELDAAAKEIAEIAGVKAIGMAADLSSVDAVNTLVAKAIAEMGHIDILVNSAGVNVRKGCLEFTEEDWDIVQDVQVKSVFFTCQAVAQHMIDKGIRGKIINLGSVNSVIALRGMISYVAAKGAIAQLTKALAVELSDYGITANAIAPGYTSTEMTKPVFSDKVKAEQFLAKIPLNRFGEPFDYAGLAVYLASKSGDYITGQLITVDGGWTSS